VLDELLATPGVEERFTEGSCIGFCALHGGLEEATAEIAHRAALESSGSFYAVVQPDDLHWHVPSHRYDPMHSDGLRAFLDHVEVVISVHGFGGVRDADDRWTTALLGGSNRELASDLQSELSDALPGYRWISDLDVMPKHLRGLHPSNPVNRARRGGVQIELPPRVRRPGADFDALVSVLAAVGANARRRCNGEASTRPSFPPLR
jgi:phage replication-related protein YjqB (UPF0714/DUF867 family)